MKLIFIPDIQSNSWFAEIMKLVDELSQFARDSSIHGLNYIAKSGSSSRVRIAWFLLFTGSMIYAGVQIADEAKGKKIRVFFLMYSGGRMRFYGSKIQTLPSVYQQPLKV